MADETKDLGTLLADAMALRVDGPSILFVRPRRKLTEEEDRAVGEATYHLTKMVSQHKLKFVLLPHDFDVMVLGDAELANLGLARIPLGTEKPVDG